MLKNPPQVFDAKTLSLRNTLIRSPSFPTLDIGSSEAKEKFNTIEDYIEFTNKNFPTTSQDFFENFAGENRDKFEKFLAICRENASKSGMATVDVLALSLYAKENNLAIIFRPINSKTRDQMKIQDSMGKGSEIITKSSQFDLISGNVPEFAGLSKLAEDFDSKQQVILDHNIAIENIIEKDEIKLAELRGCIDLNPQQLVEQKFITAITKNVMHEGESYELFFFPDPTIKHKAQSDENSKPYFAIKKGENLLFYDYENKTFKEVDKNSDYPQEGERLVKVLAYKKYECIIEEKSEEESEAEMPGFRVYQKAIIPDYDIYTLGSKRVFNQHEFSPNVEESMADCIARVEFDKLLESLKFDKIGKFSTVNYSQVPIINNLRKLTDGQINHGSEVTNSNTQDLSDEPAIVFDWSDAKENAEFGISIISENKKELIEKINELRNQGYDIPIGSRWGFDVRLESRELWEDNFDAKLNNWRKIAQDEKKLIGTLKDVCKDLYAQSKYTDFKEFLEEYSKKFEGEKIRKFIKPEYFSEDEMKMAKKDEEIDDGKAEEKLKILIKRLDIIAQEERIRQLEIAPALIYSNVNDELVGDAQKSYQTLIMGKILTSKKNLQNDKIAYLGEIEEFKKEKEFYEIISIPENKMIQEEGGPFQANSMFLDGEEKISGGGCNSHFSATSILSCCFLVMNYLKISPNAITKRKEGEVATVLSTKKIEK
jgi:hypothetical protein